MATPLGINNGNSHYNRSLRQERSAQVQPAAQSLADRLATEYLTALMLIDGGLTAKGEMMARQCADKFFMFVKAGI